MTARSVRIENDTVTRPAGPWTPTVHALLEHVAGQGVPVPRPLGSDGCRETLSLVPGIGGDERWGGSPLPAAACASAGALLRRFHDASTSFVPPDGTSWIIDCYAKEDGGAGSAADAARAPEAPGVFEVILHGDPKPGNMAWKRNEAIGLFDFDDARPGRRVDDVAYALKWIIPFNGDVATLRHLNSDGETAMRERATAFLRGYGWQGPFDVARLAVGAHERSINEVEWGAAGGLEPQRTWVATGETATWRAELPELATIARRIFPTTLKLKARNGDYLRFAPDDAFVRRSTNSW